MVEIIEHSWGQGIINFLNGSRTCSQGDGLAPDVEDANAYIGPVINFRDSSSDPHFEGVTAEDAPVDSRSVSFCSFEEQLETYTTDVMGWTLDFGPSW